MKSAKRLLLTLTILLTGLSTLGWGQGRYAIRNARIVTVSGETIERGTVLIEDGKISAVGARVRIPSRTETIEGRGRLTVYPGLFDSNTRLGLTEVGATPVTNDYNEMGEYTPHLLAFSAFHVESEHIPVARVDGITHTLTVPSGGVIPGQAALMHLYGWSPAEMEIRRRGALVLDFPSLLPLRRSFFGRSSARRPQSELKKEFDEKVAQLEELFEKARHYRDAKESGLEVDFNKQYEALLSALAGEQPVLISADSSVDIQEAVKFAEKHELNYVLWGATEAWKVADFLKEHDVKVLLGPRQSLPPREDDPTDILYRTPVILQEKGVPFAVATGSSSSVRTLPFEIGNSVPYGLSHDAAVRAITLTPAEFFGIDDQLGSIEVGKTANLVVTDGDILEYRTRIQHVFINGRPIELTSKHTELAEKYFSRP